MEARFSLVPLEELEFQGTGQEYGALAALLAARGGAMELEQRADGPAPYKHFAAKVSVRALADGMVSIRVEKEAGEIVIEGGEEAMGLFARNLESFGKYSPPGQHWHVEHFEGHACLGPGSFPCVMMLV